MAIFISKGTAREVWFDYGIAAQSILLWARGGCIIGSIRREMLRELLVIPPRYEILLVIALSRPRETVVLEEVGRPQTEAGGYYSGLNRALQFHLFYGSLFLVRC